MIKTFLKKLEIYLEKGNSMNYKKSIDSITVLFANINCYRDNDIAKRKKDVLNNFTYIQKCFNLQLLPRIIFNII